MTPEQLAELDALYAATTSGPFEVFQDRVIYGAAAEGEDHPVICDVTDTSEGLEGSDPQADTNARGIVALHNAYPALSAALKAAWADLREHLTSVMPKVCAERDRSASRLAKAEELLRRLAKPCRCGKPGCGHYDAAAFLAESEIHLDEVELIADPKENK